MGEHEIGNGGSTALRPAVFLDRDGVLNHPVVRDGQPYPPASSDDIQLYNDVVAGCAKLKKAGFTLVVVTNQPDVGRGSQTLAAAESINARLTRLIPTIDRIEMCTHAGSRYGVTCECRKPKTGMLRRAAEVLQLDLGKSFLIGDRWRDVDCARAAGCSAIFINRGYAESLRATPDFVVASFSEAVAIILDDCRL